MPEVIIVHEWTNLDPSSPGCPSYFRFKSKEDFDNLVEKLDPDVLFQHYRYQREIRFIKDGTIYWFKP